MIRRGLAAIAAVFLTGLGMSGCVTAPSRVNAFENLTPNSDYARKWTSAEAKQGVSGYTFLRNYPGKANEAIYFEPGGVAYQWVSGRTAVASGTWTVDLRSPRASETARCVDPSLFFIPATERAPGDVFALAGRPTAPADLTIERTRIEDVKRMLARTS